ncbi:hypothetical protein Tsp_07611 [Trichinella spiralis]|uniref:hypothetical protein n=1 Tax=Trichinella spiralis TaxID=6334 RepID=UPI0001EFC214|nr:hypothetical protein Tsp_07611 [Trichinella spiralis]
MNELFCSGSLKALQTLFVIYTCHFERQFHRSIRMLCQTENSAVFLKVVLIRQNGFHLLRECLFGEKAYIPFHSRSGDEWRWTNLAVGIATSSEEVAILQSKKSTESQQLSDGHRQVVKKMVLNNVINVSKKLESI